jgi:hypothetical protein
VAQFSKLLLPYLLPDAGANEQPYAVARINLAGGISGKKPPAAEFISGNRCGDFSKYLACDIRLHKWVLWSL